MTGVHNMVHGLRVSTWADWWLCQPHVYMEALHVPWPVRKRFNSDQEQRGRSEIGCREVGSSTVAQLVTEADCQSSPSWVHVYSRQIQADGMPRWKSLRWVSENISVDCPVLMVVYSTQHLVYSWLLIGNESVLESGDYRESSDVRLGCGTATAHSSWADLAKMPNSRLKSALINEPWIARNFAAV